ncbi:MAG: hypothetical protein Q9197_001084 [Variospora fuerteventurae]
MTDFQAVARKRIPPQSHNGPNASPKQFTDFYYTTFDRNRSDLAALYRDQSMLTFESSPVQGASGIVEKLVVRPSLPFPPPQPRNRSRRAKLLLFLSSLIKGLRKR